MSSLKNKNILVMVTGSISAYKACDLVARLRLNNKVQVVMTKSAQKFIGTATFEALTGNQVLTDTFEPGKALDHIHEVRKADVIVVAPATANFINKMAQGIGDDLASTMLLAHDFKKPLIVSPAMNTMMWNHPKTKESVNTLKSWGVSVVSPREGILACGEDGTGKLATPEEIYLTIEESIKKPVSKLKVLITSGGTQEPIDAVRVLTNKSSGRTGAVIADQFVLQGAEVTYLGSKNGVNPKSNCKLVKFSSFNDLEMELKQLLKNDDFDIVIHSAAVSDFSVKPASGKLSSDNTPVLEFKKNPKLVDKIKSWSRNKETKLVAFKLTANSSEEDQLTAVKKLLSHAEAEFVVSNDFTKINKEQHPATIFKGGSPFSKTGSKEELAKKLWEILGDN